MLVAASIIEACGTSGGSPTDAEAESAEDATTDRGETPPTDSGGEDDGADDRESWSDSHDDGGELGPPGDIDCGNGVVEPDEECDDGNRLNGDECDWMCRLGEGEDPPDVPPDLTVGHAEPVLRPAPLDLGVEYSNFASLTSPGNRLALASDGNSYATVWPHPATAEPDAPMEGTFIRFDTGGRRLDASWTYRLASNYYRGAMHTPRVDLGWTGSGYGLLWSGRDTWPPTEGPGLSFMELDADGKPRGAPAVLSTNGGYISRLGIAWDGEGFGCLADAMAPEDSVRQLGILRVGADGSWRDGTRHLIWETAGIGSNAFASSNAMYVATWTSGEVDTNMVRYALVAADGRPLGSTVLGPEAYWAPSPPDVVWSGEEFGIVWLGPSPDVVGPYPIYFARLSASGELLAPPAAAYTPPTWGSELAVAFGHGTYGVAWFDTTGCHLVRLDRNGTFVEHVVGPLDGTVPAPAVGLASDDAGFGMIGSEEDLSAPGLWGGPFFTWFRVTP